ncbi:hypothetical protein T265_10955 [Opisthorchis viverrini]|uniref:Uncharacterized protein n=1 Tax=Opisthorchis viverrini TaxID=6198 RepID=A0A074ZBA3_OPIVI|nr:hypothetical protein T265_10955 [Opisthorchis viverrini]KER20505.1 hypothetical protein T265_10955 [Opisthorchis viverrini]
MFLSKLSQNCCAGSATCCVCRPTDFLEGLFSHNHSGGQPLTWQRSMKEITRRLGAVGATRLPGWGPRDPHCAWLETLQDMAANRCQWRSCCQFLSRLPELPNKSWLYGSEVSVLNTDVMLSMMMMMTWHSGTFELPTDWLSTSAECVWSGEHYH